jgi:hypothetical protein
MGLLLDPSHPRAPTDARPRRRVRKLWIILGIVFLVLLGARIALTPVLLRVVNSKLDDIPDYRGHVDDLDIHLFRGAYRIQGIRLDKASGKIPVPFFKADVVDISVEWRALLHGKLAAEVDVLRPEINFVKGPPGNSKAARDQSQTGIDPSWTDKVKALSPFDLNRFRIREGQIHYRDLHRTPKVNVHIDHLEAEAKGLTNEPRRGDSLPASFNCVFRAMGHADGRIEMKLDPLAKQPTFDLNAELKGLKLTTLNDFFRAYANVDAESGTFGLYTEAASVDGRFKGYVKPILKDLKILDVKEDKENPAKLFWEAMVAGVSNILENKRQDQVATQVPFQGNFSNPKAGIWASVGALLRNAFVRALRPSLSHSVDIQQLGGLKESQADHSK